MEQEQQSMPGHPSFQRQPRTSSLGQRMFWSVFWSSFWLPFSCKQSGRGDLSDRLSAQGSRIERTCEALQLNGQLVAQPVGYASR